MRTGCTCVAFGCLNEERQDTDDVSPSQKFGEMQVLVVTGVVHGVVRCACGIMAVGSVW